MTRSGSLRSRSSERDSTDVARLDGCGFEVRRVRLPGQRCQVPIAMREIKRYGDAVAASACRVW